MLLSVRPYRPADEPGLLGLLRSPGIREQYDPFDSPDGVARLLGDPFAPAAGVRLAFLGTELAGFGYALLLPGPPAAWALLRGGVLSRFRRRGVGRALHEALCAFVRAQAGTPGVRELVVSAWQPSPGSDAMFTTLGYRPERWYWLMERPRGASPPEPEWPAGVEIRAFDGGERALADFVAADNGAFADHYRFVPGTVERLREHVKRPGFRPDGVRLAYLDGRVAGFCHCDLHGGRGEIASLGTLRAARGLGLGRALLRWGVGWLEREGPGPVTLLVDGDNEGALRLYRSEGFEVTRTRRLWARALEPA